MSCQYSLPKLVFHLKIPKNDSSSSKICLFQSESIYQSLIDRGANGRLAGADMRVLQKTHRKINIVGIDDHELNGLNVVTVEALLDTQSVLSFEYSINMPTLVKGRSEQMEWFNCKVDD